MGIIETNFNEAIFKNYLYILHKHEYTNYFVFIKSRLMGPLANPFVSWTIAIPRALSSKFSSHCNFVNKNKIYFTNITGHLADLHTPSATLPITNCCGPDLLLLPITTRSILFVVIYDKIGFKISLL